MFFIAGFLKYSVKKAHLLNRNYSFSKLSKKIKMGKSAIVLLAEGAEEMELTISVDVLRRAGVDVTIAAINDSSEPVKCSRGVLISPDVSLNKIKDNDFDVIILPGGLGGSKNLGESELVGTLLKKQEASKKLIAAICAAPTALNKHKIGLGKKITSYPSVKDDLIKNYVYQEDKVVVDDNLVTSRGPGTAFDFALTLSEILIDKETRNKVAKGLLLS